MALEMSEAETEITQFTYRGILPALEQGKQVHAFITKSGSESSIFVGNALVDMYAKCGSIKDAGHVFKELPEYNPVTWNVMIAGYGQNGLGEEALNLLSQMQEKGVNPDQVTFASVLGACAKCGLIEDARQVFDKMSEHNVISWNTMIAGYAQNGQCEKALTLFRQMQWVNTKPDQVTLAVLLSCCAGLAVLEYGKQVHAITYRTGLGSDVFVGSALVDMYAKCGSMENACRVFDNMPTRDGVAWNSVIAGHARHAHSEEVLSIFWRMQWAGMKPTQFTFASIINMCAGQAALELGKQFHAQIIITGFESNVFVGSALVDMYCKCRKIGDARNVFVKMSERDAVSWNAMIAGYALNGYGEEALKHFYQMQRAGVKPYQVTFSSVLRACTAVLSLEQGKQVHTHIIKTELQSDVFVGSALVDMYAKCGSIQDANKLFVEMIKRDVVVWNAMIAGYAHHGLGNEALQLFEQMQLAGMKPNRSTFVSVLSACSHAGLVDVGRYYFDSMLRDHGIEPSVEHYACMVDLLGRAGCLDEARDLIKGIPFEPGTVVWRTLLGACRIHDNVEIAEHAAESILKLDPQDTGTCLLLSNVYAAACRWNDVSKMRKIMKDRGLTKQEPGSSWIWVKGTVHTFVIADRSHPQMGDIYRKLEVLTGHMRKAGYVPDTNFELHDGGQVKMGNFLLSS